MIIREGHTNDIEKLAVLGAATFAGTFIDLYSAKNLKRFLADNHSEDYYRRALARPDWKIFVACANRDINTELLGYCMVKPNALPCKPARAGALEIYRLYLLEGHHSKGIGHALMLAAIEYAKAQNASEMTLGVYSENIRAQTFYGRYGFKKIGEYEFIVGDHSDREFILIKPL